MRLVGRRTRSTGLALVLLAAGCGKSPTREDCDKMVEHSIELTTKGRDLATTRALKEKFADMKASLVAECLQNNTAKHVACALAAADLPALEECQSIN